MTTIRENLHAATHQVPGVPDHNPSRNTRAHRPRNVAATNKRHAHNHQHRTAEPRVLIRWQRWIAARVTQ
jgi:hypothetical protein